MSASLDPRLERLLGGGSLAALRKRLRRQFERTDAAATQAVFRLGQLSPAEHEVLASLMGRPPRAFDSMSIDVRAIDAALQRAGIAGSLRDALEQLDGAIVHRASARAEAEARWSAIVAGTKHPILAACLHRPAGLGLLKRLAGGNLEQAITVREAADAVLARLPAGGVPRAQLAAEMLGDSHALDSSRRTGTLVLAALRLCDPVGEPDGSGEDRSEERARDVWARVGVLVNELARPALFLNLPLRDGDTLPEKPGEPGYASLRLLLRTPLGFAVAGREVFVCENPNVVAIAANHLGPHCAPLVCIDGMPAAAQRALLGRLASAGARLLYHGDFDWPGVRIANHVLLAYGAQPWRLGAADYAAAAAVDSHRRHQLAGVSVPASWDAALAPTMQSLGVAIAEESVAASLLRDLER